MAQKDKVMVCVKTKSWPDSKFIDRMEGLGLDVTGIGTRSILGRIESHRIKHLLADDFVLDVEEE